MKRLLLSVALVLSLSATCLAGNYGSRYSRGNRSSYGSYGYNPWTQPWAMPTYGGMYYYQPMFGGVGFGTYVPYYGYGYGYGYGYANPYAAGYGYGWGAY